MRFMWFIGDFMSWFIFRGGEVEFIFKLGKKGKEVGKGLELGIFIVCGGDIVRDYGVQGCLETIRVCKMF